MFNALQPWHIIVLVVVLIALFGAKRLPDAARGIGKSMHIFKAEAKNLRDEHEAGKNSDTDSDTDTSSDSDSETGTDTGTAETEPRQLRQARGEQATAVPEEHNHAEATH